MSDNRAEDDVAAVFVLNAQCTTSVVTRRNTFHQVTVQVSHAVNVKCLTVLEEVWRK